MDDRLTEEESLRNWLAQVQNRPFQPADRMFFMQMRMLRRDLDLLKAAREREERPKE